MLKDLCNDKHFQGVDTKKKKLLKDFVEKFRYGLIYRQAILHSQAHTHTLNQINLHFHDIYSRRMSILKQKFDENNYLKLNKGEYYL